MGAFRYFGYGSFKFLNVYAADFKENDLAVVHIATIDKKGKVMGYTSLRFGKKFFTLYKNADRELSGLLYKIANNFKEYPTLEGKRIVTGGRIDAYINLIYSLKNFGVEIKARPMPEYQFKDRCFQPK